jgi:hypothetical protein
MSSLRPYFTGSGCESNSDAIANSTGASQPPSQISVCEGGKGYRFCDKDSKVVWTSEHTAVAQAGLDSVREAVENKNKEAETQALSNCFEKLMQSQAKFKELRNSDWLVCNEDELNQEAQSELRKYVEEYALKILDGIGFHPSAPGYWAPEHWRRRNACGTIIIYIMVLAGIKNVFRSSFQSEGLMVLRNAIEVLDTTGRAPLNLV